MFGDLIQLIKADLTLAQFRHVLIFLIIVAYGFLVLLFHVTKFRSPVKVSLVKVFEIIGKSVLVAVVEELVFRCLLYYIFFQRVLGLDAGLAMVFTGLFFAGGHFWWIGVHVHALHKVELFIGLFLFNMILCRNFPVGNVLFHMFAILGVETTNLLFEPEQPKVWWVWDESHALIRSPIVWAVLVAYFFLV
jgi:hypothetical protein